MRFRKIALLLARLKIMRARQLLRLSLVLLCLLPLSAPAPADSMATLTLRFSVAGEGILHCFLVDEKQFETAMSGIESWIIPVRGRPDNPQFVSLSCRIPVGMYGLRAFLDTNGNRRLDRGLWGPTEPWGMSWKAERPIGFPHFRDIAFELAGDRQSPIVEVR